MKTFITIPSLTISGVNSVSIDLANALVGSRWEPHFLITNNGGKVYGRNIDLPNEIPCTVLSLEQDSAATQADILRVLSSHGPCLYLPSYDFKSAAALKRLPTSVGIVGVLHSDDDEYYQHFRNYGHFWNETVAVSQHIASTVRRRFSGADVTVIHSGVPTSEVNRIATYSETPIRVAYVGRIAQYAKRVMDVPFVAEALTRKGVAARFRICGVGPAEDDLRQQSKQLVDQGIIEFTGGLTREQLQDVYLDTDVILFTSDFEGLSISLLEGMEAGCVPVVSQIDSGFPEVIRDGQNGLMAPVGDIDAFADRIATLSLDRELLAKLSAEARQTILHEGFSANSMAERYGRVFERAVDAIESGTAVRDRRSKFQLAQDKIRAGQTEMRRAFKSLTNKLMRASQ